MSVSADLVTANVAAAAIAVRAAQAMAPAASVNAAADAELFAAWRQVLVLQQASNAAADARDDAQSQARKAFPSKPEYIENGWVRVVPPDLGSENAHGIGFVPLSVFGRALVLHADDRPRVGIDERATANQADLTARSYEFGSISRRTDLAGTTKDVRRSYEIHNRKTPQRPPSQVQRTITR
jgi:hypothetical protein